MLLYFQIYLGVVQKWLHGLRGRGVKDVVTTVCTKALVIKKRDDGGRGCQKCPNLRDVIYGRTLTYPIVMYLLIPKHCFIPNHFAHSVDRLLKNRNIVRHEKCLIGDPQILKNRNSVSCASGEKIVSFFRQIDVFALHRQHSTPTFFMRICDNILLTKET